MDKALKSVSLIYFYNDSEQAQFQRANGRWLQIKSYCL